LIKYEICENIKTETEDGDILPEKVKEKQAHCQNGYLE
jgi:hypothetical protein